jgi:hypothetical protein
MMWLGSVIKKKKAAVWFPLAILLGGLVIGSLVSVTGCGSGPPETLPAITPWEPAKSEADAVALASSEPDADGIILEQVQIAADGPMIMVTFRGPVELIQHWTQGAIWLVDENTRLVYGQIIVAPVIGPLFSRPKEDGEEGYVMLSNFDSGLKAGSRVTVVLGNYKRLNVAVN